MRRLLPVYLLTIKFNFDGIVDRFFLDSNLDGALDKIYDIALEGLKINRIIFKKFKPWHRKQLIELPDLLVQLPQKSPHSCISYILPSSTA